MSQIQNKLGLFVMFITLLLLNACNLCAQGNDSCNVSNMSIIEVLLEVHELSMLGMTLQGAVTPYWENFDSVSLKTTKNLSEKQKEILDSISVSDVQTAFELNDLEVFPILDTLIILDNTGYLRRDQSKEVAGVVFVFEKFLPDKKTNRTNNVLQLCACRSVSGYTDLAFLYYGTKPTLIVASISGVNENQTRIRVNTNVYHHSRYTELCVPK